MEITIQKSDWSLILSIGLEGARFQGGRFGELSILPSPIFQMELEHQDGTVCLVDSESGWDSVRHECHDQNFRIIWQNPGTYTGIGVIVTGQIDESGICWSTQVVNASQDTSVAMISYPAPTLQGQPLNLFTPEHSGRAIQNAGKNGYRQQESYPGCIFSMQYCAWWGLHGGIYLGVHDPDASLKIFDIAASDHRGELRILFPAIGAGTPGNSFAPAGVMRWQVFRGDWYDATEIYKNFVYHQATWLPKKGRPDTPAQFKAIPYWICDYIPNSAKQMEARPRVLAAVSERYGKDYWVDAAIELKKRLKVPVAYHIYNWHEIPFNINYPHFLPARAEAITGMQKLKEAGLLLFPYINAVSWEMDDEEEGFPVNFANTGIQGAVLSQGQPFYVTYPQQKASGRDTRLAPVCPSFTPWHRIMEQVTRGIENTLPVDGIYFDQVSAVSPIPCRNPGHDHAPGGGCYWVQGYNRMMETIQKEKPRDSFYFSECNAEAYAKSFDGFLTWVWTAGDLVPAFPAIYAGYVQLLGRYTDGANRDNDDYFRFHLAQSLLFGQQLGWLNAHVVYQQERMTFLEKLVAARCQYTQLFNEGHILRPPIVSSDTAPVRACGIVMEQVLAGIWQRDDRSETVLFAINVSKQPAAATLLLYPEEYGIPCPKQLELKMAPMSLQILTL